MSKKPHHKQEQEPVLLNMFLPQLFKPVERLQVTVMRLGNYNVLPVLCSCMTGDPAAEEWSQWSVCSLTCGQGWQVRTRSCVSSPYGTLCSGPLRETRLCNNTATCPGKDWTTIALWTGKSHKTAPLLLPYSIQYTWFVCSSAWACSRVIESIH